MKYLSWNKEEFEDLVARSIIGLYESKIKKQRGSFKCTRFDIDKLKRMRFLGCYFTPHDRIMLLDRKDTGTCNKIQTIDILNDSRPDFAILSHAPCPTDDEDSMNKDSYLNIDYLEHISKLPNGVHCDNTGRNYRLISTWHKNLYIEGHCAYVVIDHLGKIYPTYRFRPNYDPITTRCPIEKVCAETCQTEEESKRAESLETVTSSMIIQFYQDRKYLWNVTAKEGIAKATFGVYPSEIKSLFYSRELPMSETGRKRPILHWVAAHHRRLKNGIDIDIEKYLRGINEFIYQGTKFIITRPLKVDKLQNS